ncbi:MAG: hypothetical protein RLZZ15_2323 [Verrucomicrobiota bacterium]
MRSFGAVFLAAVVGATAAEPAAGEKPSADTARPAPAATEDALAAAKREFGSLKATRVQANEKTSAPDIGLTGLRTEPSATRPAPLGRGAADAAAKKNANWLVDAMAAKEPMPGASRDPKTAAETDKGLPGRGTLPGLRSAQTLDPRTSASTTEKKNEAFANPLNGYMAGWMTPRDFEILRPGLEAAQATAEFRSMEKAPDVFNRPSDVSLGESANRSPGMTVEIRPANARAENPYLQFVAPAAAANLPPPRPAFAVAPAPVANVVPPVRADALPSPVGAPIPDFVKPRTDEKYFKQLKRF